MAASSCGFDDSPTNAQMSGWEIPGNGFKYPNGSIFQRLAANGIPYRIYNDASPHPPHHSLYSLNTDFVCDAVRPTHTKGRAGRPSGVMFKSGSGVGHNTRS
jgi:hypothetical protein